MLTPIADLLYPPTCLLCHHRLPPAPSQAGPAPRDSSQMVDWRGGLLGPTDRLFCEPCERAMPTILPPVCQRCGLSLPGAYDARAICRRCQESSLAFEQARAPFLYVGLAREMIHAFKYGGHHRIGVWLAAQMARTAKHELPLTDETIVTPVPMHWVKQRLKGLNPAASLAHAIAQLLHLPYHRDTVRRTRWTPTQTRLTMHQRFRNVRQAFAGGRRQLQGNTVLLVDDVLTSGATADACAQALRAAGASQVYVLAAACASRP